MHEVPLIQAVQEDGQLLHVPLETKVPLGQEVWQIYWYRKYPSLQSVHDKLTLHDLQLSEHPTHFPLKSCNLSGHVRHPFYVPFEHVKHCE